MCSESEDHIYFSLPSKSPAGNVPFQPTLLLFLIPIALRTTVSRDVAGKMLVCGLSSLLQSQAVLSEMSALGPPVLMERGRKSSPEQDWKAAGERIQQAGTSSKAQAFAKDEGSHINDNC